jgi:hypothetical protein
MWCDRHIAPFILNLHCLSWQGGICPENVYRYQIMQALHVTLLTHKASYLQNQQILPPPMQMK